MDMDTIKLGRVYVPTLKDPLVLMTHKGPRPLQTLAKRCRYVSDYILQAAAECKTRAVLITSAVVTKLISVGRSIMKYLKRYFLKKEGVPLKELVIYKSTTKGIDKLVEGGI